MASTSKIVAVIILSLVLEASYSLPISRDLETVQFSKSVSESEVTERALALYAERVLSLDEETKPVPSFSTETVLKAFVNEENRVKRIKRHITKTIQLCPKDLREYQNRCWTQKQYDEIAGDEYVPES